VYLFPIIGGKRNNFFSHTLNSTLNAVLLYNKLGNGSFAEGTVYSSSDTDQGSLLSSFIC